MANHCIWFIHMGYLISFEKSVNCSVIRYTMKKLLLLLIFFTISSIYLMSQPDFAGTWTGQTKVEGKTSVFVLRMHDNGRFTLAYDLNPNEMAKLGSWSSKDGMVFFKGSDEELQLRQIPKGTKTDKKVCILTFKNGNQRWNTANLEDPQGLANFFGWDKGISSVVVNREE